MVGKWLWRLYAPILLFVGVGFCAGMLNGLIGTGGGVILVLYLRRLYGKSEGAAGERCAFSAAVTVVLFLSLVSAALYSKNGSLPFHQLWRFVPWALGGGAIGAFLLGRLHTAFLRGLFRILLIIAGCAMIFKHA